MSISSAADTPGTLLTYAVSTSPEHLQVSPPDRNPSYGAITIVVANAGAATPVVVEQIQFTVPVGTGAADLTVASAATGIQATASPSSQWKISQTAAGVFTATPVPGFETVTGGGLAFRLSNILLNQQVGTAPRTVIETASAGAGGPVRTPSPTATLPLAKFPYGFFLSHLAASAPQVPDGGTVTLTWAASDGPTYTIRYAGQSVDVSAVRSWTSPPLTQDTTFILRGTAQAAGDTVAESLTVTVTVADPSLTVHDLTVQTAATVRGQLFAQGLVQVGPQSDAGSLGLATVNATNPTNQAIAARNASPTAACGFFVNSEPPLSPGVVSGIGILVARPSAIGLWTNGVIASAGSTAAIAHLATAAGPRPVTSPLALDPEIHLSGTARLSGGTARVTLHADAAGAVFHDDDTPYRVLLTPTAICNGLAVTQKDQDGFMVEELAGGRSDASFDWFVVAHRRAAPDSAERASLPTLLPTTPTPAGGA
jgi:hypothetical protein